LVLAASGLALLGLVVSLMLRRRRLWVRLVPVGDGRTVVSAGGLVRGDVPHGSDQLDEAVRAVQRALRGSSEKED